MEIPNHAAGVKLKLRNTMAGKLFSLLQNKGGRSPSTAKAEALDVEKAVLGSSSSKGEYKTKAVARFADIQQEIVGSGPRPAEVVADDRDEWPKRKGGGGGGERPAKKARKQKAAHGVVASAASSKRPHNAVWFYSRSSKHGVQREYAAFSNLYGGVGSSMPVPAGHAAHVAVAGNTVAAEPPAGWPLVIAGKRWWSTEAFYQAAKYEATAPEYADVIRRCPYNAIVFALGRQKNPFAISMQKDPAVKEYYLRHFSGHKAATVRPDWDAAKDAVMLEALRAKFGAVEELRALGSC